MVSSSLKRLVILFLLSFCVLLVFVCLNGGDLLNQLTTPHHHLWHARETCSDNDSSVYLDHLCSDYLTGVVAGSLCEALCVKKEVEFVRCLGHGVKLHVLLAHWGPHTLVLKTAEPIRNYSTVAHHILWWTDSKRVISKREFVQEASMSVLMNMGLGGGGGEGERGMKEVVERLFSECDVLGDGELSYSEAVVCWSLLETDELILLSLLRGLSPIPDLYGVCGNMYATQYASSLPLLDRQPQVVDSRSWQFRARLALSLIEVARILETTSYGTLYLCDVKGENFGVVRRHDKDSLVAKTIDLDLSWFKTSARLLNHLQQQPCRNDSDCNFVDCLLSCNRGTCSGPVLSNNLQVVCINMLLASNWWPSLLHHPPVTIERELNSVVEDCVRLSQPHIDTTIMNKLLSLLTLSLHSSPSSH